MIPDLGKYGDAVLTAYGIAILMLVILVGLSLHAGAKAKRILDIEEEKVRKNGR